MGSNHSLCGDGGRRGFGRAAAVLALGLISLTLVPGCGKSGQGAKTDPEKGSDAATLNAALSQELTAARAYAHGLPLLGGRLRALGHELRAQDEEYVDALTKAIRGLGGEAEAEAGELDFSEAKGRAGFLRLAYELESAALASYLGDAPRLFTPAPRSLAASLAAGHAQHLVVLRQALGAGLAASVPEAFDEGEVPLPGAPPAGGG